MASIEFGYHDVMRTAPIAPSAILVHELCISLAEAWFLQVVNVSKIRNRENLTKGRR